MLPGARSLQQGRGGRKTALSGVFLGQSIRRTHSPDPFAIATDEIAVWSWVATWRSSTAFCVSAKLTPSRATGEGFFALVAIDRRRGEHGAKLCLGALFVAGTTIVDLLGATASAGLASKCC